MKFTFYFFVALLVFTIEAKALEDSLFGRTIEYIRLASDFPIDQIAIMSALTVHEQDTLTPEAIRTSLRNIHYLDRFSHVDVHAEPFLSGIALTFELTPDWIIDHIRFKGKQTGYLFAYGLESRISRKELLRVLDVQQNTKFSDSKLNKSIEKLKDLYFRFGYGRCLVSASVERNEKARSVDIKFTISKGEPSLIDKVVFKGNESISSETLCRQMRLNIGRRYLHSALEIDRKELQEYYQKHSHLIVKVDRIEGIFHTDTNTVTIEVSLTEGPPVKVMINAPYHWWNILWIMRHFEKRPSIAMESIGYSDFEIMDNDLLAQGALNLRNQYQEHGFSLAKVEYTSFEKSNEHFIHRYEVIEGNRYKISEIQISGNTSRPTQTIQAFLTAAPGQQYNRSSLQTDCNSIHNFYLREGFVDSSVQAYEDEIDHENRSVRIRYNIQEQNQVYISTISYLGNTRFSNEELMKISNIHTHDPFNLSSIEMGVQTIVTAYEKAGYPDSNITFEFLSKDSNARDVIIRITEGSYAEFGKILIKGYFRTKLGLIRRRIPPLEFQPFSTETVMTIQRELSQTGLFDSVRIKNIVSESNEAERTILISLSERPSLFLETGPGYNTDIGASGYLNLYTTNLYGTNRFLGTSIFYAQKAEKSQLTYREPEFAGFPIQMELRLFRNFTDESGYDLYRYGGRINWTYRFNERFRWILEYRLNEDRPLNIEPGTEIPEKYKQSVKIGSLAPSMIFDSRDDPRDPRSGTLISGKIEFSRPVYSSEVDFTKTTFEATHFLKLLRKTTLGVSLRLGWGRDLPFQETFKLGGIKTLRGWGYEDIRGPRRTEITVEGGNLNGMGGNMSLLGNIELRVPLIWGLQGVVFMDSGNVWNDLDSVNFEDLKGTIGSGIRFMTPIGPVGLDYGYNFLRDDFDHSQRWSFIIGQSF